MTRQQKRAAARRAKKPPTPPRCQCVPGETWCRACGGVPVPGVVFSGTKVDRRIARAVLGEVSALLAQAREL